MELRNLRAFEAVARTLSVTQAARDLHYAQSSISDQIQALERELGVELLDRSQRRVRLTTHGLVLAEYTERILKLIDEARYAVARPSTQLAVGALETVGLHLLPAVLSHYRTMFPDTRVSVGHDNRGALYQAVRRGDLDLCVTFGNAPEDAALRSETLAEEPLVVIVPPQHPLAGRGHASLAELSREPFLVTQPGCGFREMYDDTFGVGESAPPIAEVSSIGTLGACVATGMGCALLPLVSVRSQADRGEVAVVESEDADLRTTLTMTWLGRNSANPNLVSFQDLLRERLAA